MRQWDSDKTNTPPILFSLILQNCLCLVACPFHSFRFAPMFNYFSLSSCFLICSVLLFFVCQQLYIFIYLLTSE